MAALCAVSPAAGIVTYNDKPVEGARVVFLSGESKKNTWGCSGMTDASGKFEISTSFSPTQQAKGIPVGDYTAVVTKAEAQTLSREQHEAQAKEMQEKMKKAQAAGGKDDPTFDAPPKALVPAKYGDETKSGLKVKIEKAGNTKIELKLAD